MHAADGPGPYLDRLRYDPRYYLEQRYCNEHGLPHGVFLTWEPVDRAKAIAYEIEKGQRCQVCGTAEWEWDEKQGGAKRPYEVVPHRCPGCYALEYMQDGTAREPGVRLELARTGTQEAAQRSVRMMQLAKKGRS